MQVRIHWHEQDQIVEVFYEDAVIDDEAALADWKRLVFDGFDRILEQRGGRFPLVVHIDGLRIARHMGPRFTEEIARPVADRYATAIARCGAPMATRAVIAAETMRRAGRRDPQLATGEAYRANLFDSRRDAVQFVLDQHAQSSLFDVD